MSVFENFIARTRFKIWAIVSSLYPQNVIGNEAQIIIDRTMSNKVQFLLSKTQLSCCVLGRANCETIPQSLR